MLKLKGTEHEGPVAKCSQVYVLTGDARGQQ